MPSLETNETETTNLKQLINIVWMIIKIQDQIKAPCLQ